MGANVRPFTAQFRAVLFGVMRIEKDGESRPLPASSTARSLFAHLLFHNHEPQSRAALTGLFWPELDETRARRALSQALWQIRRAFPDLLAADADSVAMTAAAPLWVDAREFERLAAREAARHELEQALDLYRADFLEGDFHDWALLERERLRELFLQALGRLEGLEKAAGRFAKALDLAQRLSRAEPLNESAHREVMRLHQMLGQPDAALRQFEACRQALRQELEVEPEAETLALAEEIRARADKTLPAKESILAAPLVGRESDRAALLPFIEGVFHKLGGLLLLEGEAGVGKTRLLQEMAREAEWRGAQVLWGHARETQGLKPYAPLVEALQAGLTPLRASQIQQVIEKVWLQVIAPLLSPHSALPAFEAAPSLAPAQEGTRLAEAFIHFLEGWAGAVPLVVILEDLHWADGDTLTILPALARRLGPLGVLVIGSYRTEEARATPQTWEGLQAASRGNLLKRHALSRLDEAATGELIRRSLGLAGPAPLFEIRLHRETDGNPLFILESLRALQDEGVLKRQADGGWRTPWDETTRDYAELPVPPLVEQVILNRVKRLPDALRRLLETAAALGNPFEFHALAAASKLETPAVLQSARELIRRAFLEETERGYRFGHDKIRQVVYQSLDGAARRALHLQIAEALEAAAPEPLEALAYHFEKSETWDQAVVFHRAAGDQAQALHACQNAAAHFGSVLAILDAHPIDGARDLRFDALSKRQRLLWILGQADAEQADLEALAHLADELADPLRQAFVHNRRALFLTESRDDYAGGRAAAESALALSRAHADPRNEATALDTLGRVHYATDEYAAAVECFGQALSVWEALGETAELAQARVRLGRTFKMMGKLEQARAQYDAGLQAARTAHSLVDEMYVYTNLAVLSRVQGDYPKAIEFNRQALRAAREIGHLPNQAATLDNLGVAYWSLREYGRAVESMRASLNLVREMNDRRGMIFCLNNLGDVYREIGGYELAETHLTEGLALAREINFPFAEGSFQQGLGRLRIEQGRMQDARACFRQAIQIGRERENPTLAGNGLFGLALTHLRADEFSRAAKFLEEALAAHTEAGEADYAVLDRSWLALCHMEAGKTGQAAALSAQAVADLEAHGGGEEVHQIYFNHWKVLRAAHEEQPARAALLQARGKVLSQAASLTDPAQRERYLAAHLHGEILSVSESVLFERVQASLPRAGCPAETVNVTWTLAAPDDDEFTDKVGLRHHRLRRLLREAREQNAEAGYKHLAGALGVGVRTIERDMAMLNP